MQNIFNAILRLFVKLALHLYFKKIKVFGKENLPHGKSVLIVANHQNALIDPILIATHTQLKPHFLTRASAFKHPIAAKLLKFIRMIPIYRVRDGIDNMGKNKETFDRCVHILHDYGSVLIFGEGNHSLDRNLRPLKKGFARIAFQALELDPELELLILPIGINYTNHKKSGSDVSLYIGSPFSANTFYPNDYAGIIEETKSRLQPLVSEIPKENTKAWIASLKSQKVSLTDPEAVKQFLETTKEPQASKASNYLYFTNKVMKMFHFPVYWIWLLVKPKIKDLTFTATFKFVIGLVFIPLWYIFLLVAMPFLGIGSWGLSWAFLGFLYLLSNTNSSE
jgi:1-acyl-sn-glycerol-3-phosphate acyltransferase